MAEPALALPSVRRIGRYELHEEIASGGMATVYLGRLVGATGFSRPVAIKRLHDNLANDPQFVSMLLDEARLAARVRHPNVVSTLDVVEAPREVVVVMEYVHGESLALIRKIATERAQPIPVQIAASIVVGLLHGLHAAHEAVDELGEPLAIVHRDVSPQNVLVGVDGIARVLDFGIAKAAGRMQTTQDGMLKGKFGYMAPEQLKGADITRQADVYAAAVVFWETLTGRRLYPEDVDAASILTQTLFQEVQKPSELSRDVNPLQDEVVLRGLAKSQDARYKTALEMASAIEDAFGLASPVDVGNFVKEIAKDAITRKSASLAVVERADTDAGQKQRREVVARVSSGLSAYPDAPSARGRSAGWIVALLLGVFGASYAGVKHFSKTKPTIAETNGNDNIVAIPPTVAGPNGDNAPPITTVTATAVSGAVANPSPSASSLAGAGSASPSPDSAGTTISGPAPVSITIHKPGSHSNGASGKPGKPGSVDSNGAPIPAATPAATTPPATASEPPDDPGRNLIPSQRK